MRVLSKAGCAINRDCNSLENYRKGVIEFDQLKAELEEHNSCRLTNQDVEELIQLGYSREDA